MNLHNHYELYLNYVGRIVTLLKNAFAFFIERWHLFENLDLLLYALLLPIKIRSHIIFFITFNVLAILYLLRDSLYYILFRIVIF